MSLAPHRVVGHSPYHPLKVTHPPRPRPVPPMRGSEVVISYSVMVAFGIVLGYLAGRLNLLMAVLRLVGVEPQS